jgi:hypothetical protein
MTSSSLQQKLSLRHNVQGTVYVLHFEPAYKHAQHYVGWTEGEVTDRVAVHLQGPYAAYESGSDYHLPDTTGTVARRALETVTSRHLHVGAIHIDRPHARSTSPARP